MHIFLLGEIELVQYLHHVHQCINYLR